MSLQTMVLKNLGRDNSRAPKAKNVNFTIIYFEAFMERHEDFFRSCLKRNFCLSGTVLDSWSSVPWDNLHIIILFEAECISQLDLSFKYYTAQQ